MVKHLLMLGAMFAAAFSVIFYMGSEGVISLGNMGIALRLAFPLIMGSYGLFFARPILWFPAFSDHRRKLSVTLLPLVAVPIILMIFWHGLGVGHFLIELSSGVFSTIATVLVWQGFIWKKMARDDKKPFLSAIKLTLLQMLVVLTAMLIALFVAFGTSWVLKAFPVMTTMQFSQWLLVVASVLGVFGFVLVISALVNFVFIKMMESTGSIVYPSLAYGVPVYLLTWSVQWSQAPLAPGPGFLAAFISVAAIGAFIYLYRATTASALKEA